MVTGPCRHLDLFLDEHQIIRCRGRIDHLIIPENSCTPVLVDVDSPMVYAIIMSVHKHAACSSKNNTIHRVKLKYYEPRLRAKVNKVNNRCNLCRYLRAMPYQYPITPPFKPERLAARRPFAVTGLDFAGPFPIMIGDTPGKVWICVFTCLVSRAIHFEIAHDSSADFFFNYLRT